MKTLSDYIAVVTDLLSPADCAGIVQALNATSLWAPTKVDEGVLDSHTRNCDAFRISSTDRVSPGFAEIEGALFKAVNQALEVYKHVTQATIPVEKNTGFEALRYREGGFYKTHVDHFQQQHRTVSCSIALNDDFEGGQWGFFGEEEVVKAPVGSIILFPSNFCFPHQILPVTSGTRYSIVSWFI